MNIFKRFSNFFVVVNAASITPTHTELARFARGTYRKKLVGTDFHLGIFRKIQLARKINSCKKNLSYLKPIQLVKCILSIKLVYIFLISSNQRSPL